MEEDGQILANDYSQYLKVDTTNYVKSVEDSINETLANLEEYARVVELMRSDSSVSVSTILNKKADLLALFDKIRKLEYIVGVVKRNVDEIETMVLNAETDLKITTEGKLRSFLKNVLFKKKPDSCASTPVNSRTEYCFIHPQVFSTSELFGNSNSLN
ncbi:hypothetical protein O3M35_002736 [Rhynocoris fuscipes]|uniref:Biogenesis of lysosome-related organelles complex 1 subunit 4 n=1 Tax=Rhynocoris fuscipes TaxID=488301 RepID=A0AAW1CNX3_9HEMI